MGERSTGNSNSIKGQLQTGKPLLVLKSSWSVKDLHRFSVFMLRIAALQGILPMRNHPAQEGLKACVFRNGYIYIEGQFL